MTHQLVQNNNKIKKIIAKIFPHLLLPILVNITFFLSGFFIKDNYTLATSFATIAITFATPKIVNLSKLTELVNDNKIDNRSILEVRIMSHCIIALSSYISGKLQSIFYEYTQKNYGVFLIFLGTNIFHQAMFHLLEDGFNIDCYRALGERIKESINKNFDFNTGYLTLVIRGLPANEILKIEKQVAFQESIAQPHDLNQPLAK